MLQKTKLLISSFLFNSILLTAVENCDVGYDTSCDDCSRPFEYLLCANCGGRYIDEKAAWFEDGDIGNSPSCNQCNTWFPEATELYKPYAADPREVDYSVGWRFDDQVLHKDVADVSFGDSWAVYEWCNFGPWRGKLQFEVVGAVWAVFSPHEESAPLINADYMGGGQFTYAFHDWAFRLRGFHISSHIGDEFLLMHPRFNRLNPSAEYVDFSVTHYIHKDIRLYGGLGWIVHQDTSFKTGRFYAEAGMEIRPLCTTCIDWHNQLYGTPFFAMHFRYNSDFKRHVDMTYVLGYEWGKICGLYRKVRVFIIYHDGYSVEGQFARFPTKYLGIRASYGF